MILITGANGRIGTIVTAGLSRDIKQYDLPEFDVLNLDQLKKEMTGCEAVIHLAWNIKEDNFDTGWTDPNNYAMVQNVLSAAAAVGTKRVILASSIHADEPQKETGEVRSPFRLPEPDSPYGASKVAAEALGRYYAAHKGLEVICIRFGWVGDGIDTSKPWPLGEGWLESKDCISLLHACLDTPSVPYNYTILYGLSRREAGVHDLSNPFRWQPQTTYGFPVK